MEIRKTLLDKIAMEYLQILSGDNGLIKMPFHTETYRILFNNCFPRFKIRLKMFAIQVLQIDWIAKKGLMEERCFEEKKH